MSAEKALKTVSFGRLTSIFAAILLLFLVIASSQTREKLNSEFDRKVVDQLASSLDPVIMQTSDESFIYQRFHEIMKTAMTAGVNSLALQQKVLTCCEHYKLPVKLFFYQNHRLIRSFYANDRDLQLFTPLMPGIHAENEEFNQAQRQLHQKLLAQFGPGHRLELMKITEGRIKRYRVKDSDQFYLWQNLKNGLTVFFIATRPNTSLERFASIYQQPCEFGMGDPEKQRWIPPAGLSADQTAAAYIKAGLTGKNHTIANDHIWYFVTDETGDVWCRVIGVETSEKQRPRWPEHILVCSTILFIIVLVIYLSSLSQLFPGKAVCNWLDSLSIRYRVLGLFTMASIFPVIFTLLIGATSLADRAEVIENSIISESIAAIDELENMVNIKIAQAEQASRELRQALLTTPASEKLFQQYMQKNSVPRLLSRLEVRDGECNILFTTDDREVHGVSEAMDVFSRIALKLHSPGRMGAAINRVSPAEIMSESVLSTDEIGMATIIRQRGRQWIFRMGTFPTTWYWDAYPEIATGPAFMCVTTQLQILYEKQILDLLADHTQLEDSFSTAISLNHYYTDFKLVPEYQNIDRKALIAAALTSFRSGRVINRVTDIDGRPFWLVAKAENAVGTHVFMHLISQEERLKGLAPLKWKLAVSGLVALIVSLLGAMLVTRIVILPVQDLGEGIRAIRERNHDFRTPVRRDDEFGALASAFNKVISELKELEYGKIVQESLLPQAPIVPDGYDIAFFNTSATDLAGDYHDTIQLDDGRLAIILGDVTGHGISAALAMAMAKATVNHTGRNGAKYPQQLMDSLNALFNKELKPRHKFMTLVTTVIDPTTGKLEVDNAGQSYPRFFSAANGCSSDIEIPSMPLGAMKKRRPKIETRMMQSDDALILYSDGIIECSAPGGEMFGYDRFNHLFDQLMRQKMSAQAALKQLMQALDSFREPGAYPDDVTLVIIRKL